MAVSALGLFLLEAGVGTAALLVFFPHRVLGRGFFALHGAIAVASLALAQLTPPPGFSRPLALAALCSIAVYTMLARVGRQKRGLPALALGAAAGITLLARVGGAIGGPWVAAGALSAALLFGSVLLTMNLGHWYLVSQSLPKSLLFGGAVAFSGLALLRAAFLAAVAIVRPDAAAWESLTSIDREGLFFLFRVLWGVAGPLALSYFVFQTAKIRSNKAATGLLYVALVFVLVGELLAAYLTVATRSPA
jgi:protein NrfD